jgi:Domain of unknown function (DUF4432)
MTRYQSWILTDVARDLWLDSFGVANDSLDLQTTLPWSIRKRTLRGGLRAGIDVVEVNNGALVFTVLPTRGMGIWRGDYRGLMLGWAAPVLGPVHPRQVNLAERGGLGWLGGFDELLCRCGLASNGPPGEDVHTDQSGRVHREMLTLHGRIANQPAHYVEVRVNLDPPHDLSVTGEVEEGGLFFPHLRLKATLTTVPGSNRVVIHDIVENRGGTPAEMQLLYHLNVGQPFLEAGSRVLAPIREMAPRDERAAEGAATWDTYAGPTAGFAEQCYYCDLACNGAGRSLVMLYNRAVDKGLVVRLNHRELPCFSVWRYTAAVAEGYVTGFEPGTNYPNFRAFERQKGRVRLLPPGGRWECTWSMEVHDTSYAVAAVQAEIANIQAHAPAVIHTKPSLDFAPR